MKPSCLSAKIDLSLADKLRKDLEEQGFSFSQPPHTLFAAKKRGIVCVLYQSGALIVQGKEKDAFIEFYLEPEILKTFSYTHPAAELDSEGRIGVDEAGKGDFFGPLCIAGVFAEKEGIRKLLELGVRDSKRLSDSSIRKIAKKIHLAFPCAVLRLFPLKYNELYAKFKNLNTLLAWAHATIIEELATKTHATKALIDQFAEKSVLEKAIARKNLSLHVEQKVHGEEDPVVAAASILARNSFLEGMEKLGEEISFSLPKGASQEVLLAGVTLVKKWGPSILEKVSKTHFKTKEDLLKKLSEEKGAL